MILGMKTIHKEFDHFTPVTESGGLETVPFLLGVDPKGILSGMTKGNDEDAY